MATKADRPKVLIEQWLPIAEIGAECMRERGASSALPPLYFLHVWWARRPLTVSRAAILASLLPAYPTGDDDDDSIRPWPQKFLTKFPTFEAYKAWFLKLIGIHGDPVTAQTKIIEWEKTNWEERTQATRTATRERSPEIPARNSLIPFTTCLNGPGARARSPSATRCPAAQIPFEALARPDRPRQRTQPRRQRDPQGNTRLSREIRPIID